jgi:hypothetical protein
MSGYLARLKSLNSEKHAPKPLQKLQEAPSEFPETTTLGTAITAKSPFYSFCSSQGGHSQKIESSEPECFCDAAGLAVICYTPAGVAITVQARDEAHAEQLRIWNPKPARAKLAPFRCADCQHAKPTGHPGLIDCTASVPAPGNCGPFRWWADDSHDCRTFTEPKTTKRSAERPQNIENGGSTALEGAYLGA